MDNKVFQPWIICANTQILSRDVDFFAYRYVEVICAYSSAYKLLLKISANSTYAKFPYSAKKSSLERRYSLLIIFAYMHAENMYPRLKVLAHIRK